MKNSLQQNCWDFFLKYYCKSKHRALEKDGVDWKDSMQLKHSYLNYSHLFGKHISRGLRYILQVSKLLHPSYLISLVPFSLLSERWNRPDRQFSWEMNSCQKSSIRRKIHLENSILPNIVSKVKHKTNKQANSNNNKNTYTSRNTPKNLTPNYFFYFRKKKKIVQYSILKI